MGRGPNTFKKRDVTRLIKAAQAAGVKSPLVEIGRDGILRVVCESEPEPQANGEGEWSGVR